MLTENWKEVFERKPRENNAKRSGKMITVFFTDVKMREKYDYHKTCCDFHHPEKTLGA